MAKTAGGNGRLPTQVESPTSNCQQNHRLGSVRPVCSDAWEQDSSSDGNNVGEQDKCSNYLTRVAKNRLVSKKKTYGYCERDEAKRANFLAQLADIPLSKRVYVDESGMDERDDYGYGWCERGKQFLALKSGRRTGRVNMIAAYCGQQLIAPFTVEGSCNRMVFQIWLETCLLPVLKPGQVVILDNATFHQGGRIATLIETAGCRLLYLPPYSPDFNRIEKCWAWLKRLIRQGLPSFDSLRQTMEAVLKKATS